MNIFIAIVSFLLAIFLLVLVHEYGHFLAARLCGVKILRFSFGFGRPLWQWKSKKHHTEYVIATILLGGYVKLLDSREVDVSPAQHQTTYDHQPFLRKIFIFLSGPFSNFLFALLAFWLMFAVGVKLPKPIIGKVIPHSLAQVVGIKAGAEIVSVDHKFTANWQDVIIKMIYRYGEEGQLTIKVQPSPLASIEGYRFDLNQWQSNAFRPDPLRDFGIIPYHPVAPPVIGELERSGPAAKAGLEKNDVIISIDNQKMQNWDDIIDFVKQSPHQKMSVKIRRNREVKTIVVTAGTKFSSNWQRVGYLGIKSIRMEWPPEMIITQKYSWLMAGVPALGQVVEFTDFNWVILKKIVTRKISLHVLGGPLSIFQTTAQALQRGLVVYTGVLALISVALGFINLLPIPGLDGGNILIILIEKACRKTFSNAIQLLLLRLGMIFLAVMIFQATVNDVMRLFN